jgi:hypothetical protein
MILLVNICAKVGNPLCSRTDRNVVQLVFIHTTNNEKHCNICQLLRTTNGGNLFFAQIFMRQLCKLLNAGLLCLRRYSDTGPLWLRLCRAVPTAASVRAPSSALLAIFSNINRVAE